MNVNKQVDTLHQGVVSTVTKDEQDYSSVNLHLKPFTEPGVDTGLPEAHQHAITRVANEENIIIGIRPIDPKSTSLIESGVYSSKGLAIKGKSADWGPHSGFIPVDQQYAKKSGREAAKKFNHSVQGSLQAGKAISVHLSISNQRLEELQKCGAVSSLAPADSVGYQRITAIVDGQECVFFLKKKGSSASSEWQVYYPENNQIKTFQVLGDPKTGKPITADYDLFSIIFPISELEHYVKVTEMPTWEQWKATVNYEDLTGKQKKLFHNEAEYNRYEGRDNGITNKKIKQIKDKLNYQLGRGSGFEMVHHGADDANPASVMNENFPITFFLPDSLKGKNKLIGTSQSIETYFQMNAQGAIIIHDVEQLSNFQQLLINQGYRAPLNRKWSEGDNGQLFDPQRKLSKSFLDGISSISRKKSLIKDLDDLSIDVAKENVTQQIDDDTGDQVDDKFKNIFIADDEYHHSLSLAGEQSTNIDSFDLWLDPMLKYKELKSLDAEGARQSKPTEYSYNVIIQIEGDRVSNQATANAFSKHPDDSMIIQYDLTTHQYKVIHGDLDRLKTGKIRWITVGHGKYHGDHQQTLYAGKSAQEYVNGIRYLKRQVLNNRNPDKLVLLGCNLSRGGVNENFAIKAVSLFAEHDMNMPITAYNRPVRNMYLGTKLIQPAGDITESVNTKGFKFIYQNNPETQQIRINRQSSALYFINEVRRGELSINQLNDYTEPDHFSAFRELNTRSLDLDLLKKVAYNPEAYTLFVAELKKYAGELPDSFYHDFSKKLNQQGITSIPLWKMVDKTRIQKQTSSMSGVDNSNLTVVIRLVESGNGRQLAEKLAAKNPDNTLIFQMDTSKKKWTIEYGDASIASLMESQKPVNWVLLGDIATLRKPNIDLVSGLISVKQKYPFAAPEHILYHSVDKGMITESGEHRNFTSELEFSLKQYGFDTRVSSKFTEEPTPTSTGARPQSFLGEAEGGYLSIKKAQQVQLLFEKVALKEVDITEICLADHPYLVDDFMDANGEFDQRKFKIVLNDPLVNAEYNQALEQGKTQLSSYLSMASTSDLQLSHQQQAKNISMLLLAIKNDPIMINHLSDGSIQQLNALFPSASGIDSGEVLLTVTDHNRYTLISGQLTAFSELGQHNYTGDDTPLKSLSFADAFHEFKASRLARGQQYNQLVNQSHQYPFESQFSLLDHGVFRKNGHSQHSDQRLGIAYGMEFHVAGEEAAIHLFERQANLEYQQNHITEGEITLRNQLQAYTRNIDPTILAEGVTLADQSFMGYLASLQGQERFMTQLRGKNSVYTFNFLQRNGRYELSLFDPNGILLSVRHENLSQAKKQFEQVTRRYFNESIQLADGESIPRHQYAGIDVEPSGHLRGDLYQVDLSNPKLAAQLSQREQQRTQITQHPDFVITQNQWVYFNGDKLPLATLQNLNATMNGRPITLQDVSVEGWQRHVRFDPEKLSIHLTFMEGNETDNALVKLLMDMDVDQGGLNRVLNGSADFQQSAILKKQFQCLVDGVDIDNPKLMPATLDNLRQVGTKIPRYQRLANRFGQAMGTAGAIQCVIGIYSILNRLDNPDLTDDERRELEKQLYLSSASAFFNYGDMIIQPILTNIAAARGTSSLMRARLAAGVVIIFNLVGMGIDAYQAYENLSKLDSVTDPKQRQDLIVNAAFSIASFVINGVTVVGMIVGASTIPVAGLVVGGILIVGGWIYNGVRAVENIKAEIDISAGRELEEGIRGALGLEPTQRTQQELLIARYIDAFKQSEWGNDLAHFEQTILLAGFDNHLSVIEKPIYDNEDQYYLVDQDDNYFGGTYESVRYGPGDYRMRYSQKGAPSFNLQDSERLLSNYYLQPNGWARKIQTRGRPNSFHFKKECKEIHNVALTGSEATHEFYYFNPSYQNPLLEQFKAKHFASSEPTSLSTQQQLSSSNAEQLRFYSKKSEFGVLGQQILRETYKRQSEYVVNDKSRMALYLDNRYNRGSSFNTANGNDIIIGKESQRNAFQVLSGEKYFAGGDKDDLFYLKDSSLASLSHSPATPSKYLDGQGGQDSLIFDNLPKDHRVYVNLEKNSVHYKAGGLAPSLSVAHLQSIEHVLVRGNSDDSICGDLGDNLLDGGLGRDVIMGLEGNDKLILTQGNAIGGAGNDSYHVRRFAWHEHVNDLYQTYRRYDRKTKQFKNNQKLNAIYSMAEREYSAEVVIDEQTKSLSVVGLEYSLNEISDLYVDGEQLYVQITLPPESIENKTFSNISSKVTLQFNHVYKSTAQGRVPHHQYRIQTRDGFILDMQLAPQSMDKPKIIRDKLFQMSYLQERDEFASSEHKKVLFDEEAQSLLIDGSRQYQAPQWGVFIPNGLADNLEYHGNAENNVMKQVKSGNHIFVSSGIDTYQITQVGYQQGDVVFDFTQMQGTLGEKDKLIVLLPTENGYACSMEGTRLVLKNPLGETQLGIRFDNLSGAIKEKILLQDKYSNVFKIELQGEDRQIIPVKPLVSATEKDDVLILPAGYLADTNAADLNMIEGLDGDDVILNNSQRSYVLNGGKGDDTLKAEAGHHVLYGGSGHNYLSGGDGDDLLLSSQGDDTLMGGKGNDHYVINGCHAGVVYVEDIEGENQIHLVGFKADVIEERINGVDYRTYLSSAGKIVRVKQSAPEGKSQYHIHHYAQLNDKYQNMMNQGMEPLVSYLAQELSQAYKAGTLATWRPANAMYDQLAGTVKPLNQTLGNDGIILRADGARAHWLINTFDGHDDVVDQTQYGRVFNGGKGNDKLIAFGGENVIYGGEGHDILLAQGMGQDVLISLAGNDNLSADKGDDLYLVSGHGKGDVTIKDTEGRNQVALIDFNTDPVSYREISAQLVETTYQSESGRRVTLRHNNHLGSITSVMQVSHLNGYQSLSKTNVNSTVDRLVQVLAQQRIEHEANFNPDIDGESHRNQWGVVQASERFFNQLT